MSNDYGKRLKRDISTLKELNDISDEKLNYFKLLYCDLEEEEYITKMALVTTSFNLIGNISNEERALFTEGMYAYIKLSKAYMNVRDEAITPELKKNLILEWAKEDFELGVVPIIYEEGINSAMKLVDKALKDIKTSKIRKRN